MAPAATAGDPAPTGIAGRRNAQAGWALAGTVAFVGGLGVVVVLLKLALH